MRRSQDSPGAVERVRDQRPDDDRWRADASASSHHTRLLDELRMPVGDHDPDRAMALCADVCRDLLGELAPALILLPETERHRLQALAAYTRTLFDFALDAGMHGERLARINRWEFTLEQALDGEEAGQPVFVAMARAHATRPWDREALDSIAAAARLAAIHSGYESAVPSLLTGLTRALVGVQPSDDFVHAGAGLLSSISNQVGVPGGEHAPLSASSTPHSLEPVLHAPDTAALPIHWRRFFSFLAAAGDEIARRKPGSRASLSLLSRIRLLIRAWLSR